MEVINGVLFHAVGASSASLCYTPQKKVKGWSWQTYWLTQASVCWLILPLIIAYFTIPQLLTVLKEAPAAAMQKSFLLGMAYGVGGTAFGIAIRYVGFSLTYAISVGISCVLGTILPPIVDGTIHTILESNGISYLVSGISMGVVGIAVCGMAGRSKEKDIERRENSNTTFSLRIGLPICLLAGVLSAFYGFSLNQGQPIADVAARYGAGNYQGNVIYIFSNSGAFVIALLYTLFLHKKGKTFHQFTSAEGGSLGMNYLMSILTGLLWYGQFFFYGLGHVRMGTYQFTSWAIHMIMLVLLSAVAGLVMKEWKNSSNRTIRLLVGAILILITAVLLLTYGNKLGSSV